MTYNFLRARLQPIEEQSDLQTKYQRYVDGGGQLGFDEWLKREQQPGWLQPAQGREDGSFLRAVAGLPGERPSGVMGLPPPTREKGFVAKKSIEEAQAIRPVVPWENLPQWLTGEKALQAETYEEYRSQPGIFNPLSRVEWERAKAAGTPEKKLEEQRQFYELVAPTPVDVAFVAPIGKIPKAAKIAKEVTEELVKGAAKKGAKKAAAESMVGVVQVPKGVTIQRQIAADTWKKLTVEDKKKVLQRFFKDTPDTTIFRESSKDDFFKVRDDVQAVVSGEKLPSELSKATVAVPEEAAKAPDIMTTIDNALGAQTGFGARSVRKAMGVPEAAVKPTKVLTDAQGESIASRLGLRYDGIQENIGGQFTDVSGTGTTFYGNSLKEVKARLAEAKAKFAAAEKPAEAAKAVEAGKPPAEPPKPPTTEAAPELPSESDRIQVMSVREIIAERQRIARIESQGGISIREKLAGKELPPPEAGAGQYIKHPIETGEFPRPVKPNPPIPAMTPEGEIRLLTYPRGNPLEAKLVGGAGFNEKEAASRWYRATEDERNALLTKFFGVGDNGSPFLKSQAKEEFARLTPHQQKVLTDNLKEMPLRPVTATGAPVVAKTAETVGYSTAVAASERATKEAAYRLAAQGAVDKFIALAGRMQASIRRTEALRKPYRAEQQAALARIAQERKGLETIKKMSAAREGKHPIAEFEEISSKFTKDEVDQLHNLANDAYHQGIINEHELTNSGIALQRYMDGIKMPVQSELDIFKQIYGEKFAEAVRTTSTMGKVGRAFLNASGLLRANKASTDISGTLRQGLIYFARRPQDIPKNVVIQLRSIFDEKYAIEFDKALRESATYIRARDEGYRYFSTFTGKESLGKMEEQFMSQWAKKIPWIKMSERGFVNGLNKIRLDRAAHDYRLMDALTKNGIAVAEKDIKDLAQLANALTGRGDLPRIIQQHGALLNNLMFSPRYFFSRLEFAAAPWKGIKVGRNGITVSLASREAAKDMLCLLAWGSGILASAGLLGAKIEQDGRSSDFGKIVIGNTRIDMWAGYAQFVRLTNQLITAERKTTEGEIQPINRFEAVSRFAQSKLSPGFNLVIDMLYGRLFTGEKIEWTPESMASLGIDFLVPMVLSDIIEAARIENLGIAAWSGGLSAVGLGVATYDPVTNLNNINATMASLGEPNEAELEKRLEAAPSPEMRAYIEKQGLTTSMGFLGAQIEKNLRSIDKEHIAKSSLPPLVKQYVVAKESFEAYEKIPPDQREVFRARHPDIEANLVFWGKVDTIESGEALEKLLTLVKVFGVPEKAIPFLAKRPGLASAAPPVGSKGGGQATAPANPFLQYRK